MFVVFVAVSAYAAIYLVNSLVISIGIRNVRRYPLPEVLPRVSVVICARNEEANLPSCLEHLRELDYPRERLEILLVDDESTDRTGEIMRAHAERNPQFRVLSTEHEPKILPAKQRPLNMGVRESTGEFVCITDADIAVRPGWIRAHLAAYSEKIGIVGATTRVDYSSGKLFDCLQCVELVSKHAVAMGCVGLGYPLTIMGNNFSFRCSAYDQIGGFPGMKHSVVEDMALMNAITKETPYSLNWAADRAGVVISQPEKNMNTFINQRFRWIFEIVDLAGIGKIMITMESLMTLSFLTALAVSWVNPIPLAIVSLAWILGYALFLAPSPGREKGDLRYIPAALLFQMLEAVLLGMRKLFGKRAMVWKDREYTKGLSDE